MKRRAPARLTWGAPRGGAGHGALLWLSIVALVCFVLPPMSATWRATNAVSLFHRVFLMAAPKGLPTFAIGAVWLACEWVGATVWPLLF